MPVLPCPTTHPTISKRNLIRSDFCASKSPRCKSVAQEALHPVDSVRFASLPEKVRSEISE
jgi:hypothetical protein